VRGSGPSEESIVDRDSFKLSYLFLIPLMTVRYVPFRGTSHKVWGIKIDRGPSPAFSDEATYFFLKERNPKVVDIRENSSRAHREADSSRQLPLSPATGGLDPTVPRPSQNSAKPFRWIKSADDILNSLAKYCERTNDSGH
jgi:hypothetical protein